MQLRSLSREVQVKAPAGSVCSSLRAELVAIKEALSVVTNLSGDELNSIRNVRLLTD